MSDVKEVVIKLPKEIYERFGYEYSEESLITKDTNEAILDAFIKGIVLPEGHGDIVDIKTLTDMFWDGNSMEITKDDLSAIEPLIEADKKDEVKQKGRKEE